MTKLIQPYLFAQIVISTHNNGLHALAAALTLVVVNGSFHLSNFSLVFVTDGNKSIRKVSGYEDHKN